MSDGDLFSELTPDHILNAVEQIGQRSTGRFFALNSLENRVYEVELEEGEKVVGKFYRPGRWSRETILEEHEFLHDLALAEVPVVEPLKLSNGSTLGETEGKTLFTVFPKVRGKAPEELKVEQLIQLGRFIGRIHNVGAQKKAPHRLLINPTTYATNPLKFLKDGNWIQMEFEKRYQECVENIVKIISPWFEGVETFRIHGDCHLGNLLYNNENPFFLDFDDMVTGPPIQDLWLLAGGRDEESRQMREKLLQGYMEMRQFDKATVKLTEPLRALRIIHYSAWIAKRWKDLSFPRAFPDFNTHKYWASELDDLERQLDVIKKI